MIRNQWYVVLESDEVKAGKPVGVTRLGEKMVFWRDDQGKACCMVDVCPHLGAPLSLGKVKDGHITCPFHGFEYDTSGHCVVLPAYGSQGKIPKALRAKTYPVHEARGLIWIWWGESAPEDLQLPRFFESLEDESFVFGRFRDHWPVHYSRMAENQLDVMHLPFVHHNTIGRGNRSVVDGPYIELDEGLMNVWVMNRLDDGSPVKKPKEVSRPDRRPFLQFRFPNLWHNWISDDIRIVIAFVPVDDENTIMMGRFYQKAVRFPLAAQLFNLSGVLGSRVVANQDKRVVSQQVPVKTSLHMGEKMMSGDYGILTFRTERNRLKALAGQTED
ncbi:MAG: aromatic ring-hydroxylating dioxygenase subunit alpha [Chloroflexi bacterium]|nr:aromatic ring-hydroxylating dioxygenase subunit alpha [Chloroflexota bacterium]